MSDGASPYLRALCRAWWLAEDEDDEEILRQVLESQADAEDVDLGELTRSLGLEDEDEEEDSDG